MKKTALRRIRSGINSLSGFSLIEVLLVVVIISILAGISIVAMNPVKQMGDAKNAQREADINTILGAVYQYSIDNNGVPPAVIMPTGACADAANEICKAGAANCTGLIDLGVLVLNQKYLTAIPTDPGGGTAKGSGYGIVKSANGRITVCAPSAELGAEISITR